MRPASAATGVGADSRTPGPSPASKTSSASSDARCSTRIGPGPAQCTPTWASPSAAPSTSPARAARKVPTRGPGTSARPQLLEDDDGVRHPEAGAHRLGQRQREHACLAERGPVVDADGACVAFPGAQAFEG